MPETNLFGALWVTQAVLPILRAQRSGHIIQVSSIGGVNAFPMIGLYHASKWGLEAFSQSLAAEVAGLGIKVTVVEPSGFATDWGGPSAKHATPLPAYESIRAGLDTWRKSFVPGDPEATGPAILKVVDAADPPLRILFGSVGLPMMRAEYAKRIETWEKWNPVSIEARVIWRTRRLASQRSGRVLRPSHNVREDAPRSYRLETGSRRIKHRPVLPRHPVLPPGGC